MAKTPKNIGHGEGGSRTPKLQELLDDIAKDLEDVFDEVAGLSDADRRHRAAADDERPTSPNVTIESDNLEAAFTDEEASHTYDTDVEIGLKESTGVETDGLTVRLEVIDGDDDVEFYEEETPSQISDETTTVTLSVDDEITDADTYTAVVTVSGENFDTITISHEFEVTSGD